MSKKSFWDFPPYAKYDEILEDRHEHLYHGALSDMQTGIDKIDANTYIIFGDLEALLIRPTGVIYRIGLELLRAFIQIKQ